MSKIGANAHIHLIAQQSCVRTAAKPFENRTEQNLAVRRSAKVQKDNTEQGSSKF